MHRAFSGANQIAVADEKKQLTADSKNQPRSVLIDCVARQVYPVVPVHAGAALIKFVVFVQPLDFFQAVIVRECIHIVMQTIKNSCAVLKTTSSTKFSIARTDFILGIIQASSAKTCRKINCQRTEKYN